MQAGRASTSLKVSLPEKLWSKMKRPGKKRALAASWEGPYKFIGHVDGKGNYDFEEG
jgi:hypothetical protein